MAIFFIKLNHFKILTLKIGIFLKNIKQTSIKLEFTSKCEKLIQVPRMEHLKF